MRGRIRWWVHGAGLSALTATAMIGAHAIGERAEALFFRQQSAQSSLADTIVRLEAHRPNLASRFYGMEDELHEACAPLREASLRKVTEEAIDTDLEWAVVSALESCERKTRQVEQLVRGAESGGDTLPMPDLSTAGRPDSFGPTEPDR